MIFLLPKKKYAYLCVCNDADKFDQDAIQQKIHSLYKLKNLSLTKILVCVTM